MTPGVNLLPARYIERIAERRWVGVVVAALLALLAMLTLASVAQSRELNRGHEERRVEQARYDDLQARRAKLRPFRELADRITGRERLLAAAMNTEVSWAGVLDSLSSTFPADASLTALTAETKVLAFGSVPPLDPRSRGSIIGATTLKGYSVEKFTPGVERTLQLLATVAGMSEPRLQVGVVEEIGDRRVTSFEGTTFINATALSGRYADGLPPEDDVDVPLSAGAGGVTTATVPPSGSASRTSE